MTNGYNGRPKSLALKYAFWHQPSLAVVARGAGVAIKLLAEFVGTSINAVVPILSFFTFVFLLWTCQGVGG